MNKGVFFNLAYCMFSPPNKLVILVSCCCTGSHRKTRWLHSNISSWNLSQALNVLKNTLWCKMSQCFIAQPVNVAVVSTNERYAVLLQFCKTEWWGLFLFFHISGVACAQDSSPLWISNTSFYQWNQDISNVPCPLSGYWQAFGSSWMGAGAGVRACPGWAWLRAIRASVEQWD